MLNEQFIILGRGYSDVFELIELMQTNKHRLHQPLLIRSKKKGQDDVYSLAVAFSPAQNSQFMPIYISLEGITAQEGQSSKRLELFQIVCKELECTPVEIEVKHSSLFEEQALFFQYVIGVLRLNHLIPPLS